MKYSNQSVELVWKSNDLQQVRELNEMWKHFCKMQYWYGIYFIGNVTVNHAHIVESEVFVYNLGTMYYIDDILYPEIFDKMVKNADTTTAIPTTLKLTTSSDAEQVPIETVTQSNEPGKDIFVLNERGGNIDESSDLDHDLDADEDDDDDEIVTPRALPVQFMIEPPKK